MELNEVFTPAPLGASALTARVIKIEGRKLTVDLGGPIVIRCVDSCNPLPDQHVYIVSDRGSMMAVGAVDGVYRQPTVVVTSTSPSTVTGVVNGVSQIVPKMGEFTPSLGDVLPLIWSADASAVWAGGKPGIAYVPPPATGGSAGSGSSGTGGGGSSAGGGSTGGGGIVTSGTATYAAQSSGYTATTGGSRFSTNYGDLVLGTSEGFLHYGPNRMNELQGRSIQWGTISLPRVRGAGAVTLTARKGASFYSSSVSPGGNIGLTGSFLSMLINGTGLAKITVTGSGILRGTPYGTLRIGWRSP